MIASLMLKSFLMFRMILIMMIKMSPFHLHKKKIKTENKPPLEQTEKTVTKKTPSKKKK